MTLYPTEPEPLCDVQAQLAALRDPAHPKRAVWVSACSPSLRENPNPGASRGNGENPDACALVLPAGTLYGEDAVLAALERRPDDATLARLLDYVEPKSALGSGCLPVVQALDKNGFVILEMVSSWQRVGEAKARAQCYAVGGTVRIVSMQACLERRRLLIDEEARILAQIKAMTASV